MTLPAGPGGENLGPGSYSTRDLKASFSLTLESPSDTAFGMSWSSADVQGSMNMSARPSTVNPEALMTMTGRKPRRSPPQQLASNTSTTSMRRGLIYL